MLTGAESGCQFCSAAYRGVTSVSSWVPSIYYRRIYPLVRIDPTTTQLTRPSTMAESIEEFFTYDRLTDTNLRECATLVHIFLQGKTTASETAQSLTAIFDAPNSAVMLSDVLDECIVCAAEQLQETHDALIELLMELQTQQQRKSEDDLAKFRSSLIMCFGERWARYGDPDPDNAWKEQARLEWTSLNHFAAVLYSAGNQSLASFGEQTLTMTLRKESWRVNWNGPESKFWSLLQLRWDTDHGQPRYFW